jgi:hypothetical protein
VAVVEIWGLSISGAASCELCHAMGTWIAGSASFAAISDDKGQGSSRASDSGEAGEAPAVHQSAATATK